MRGRILARQCHHITPREVPAPSFPGWRSRSQRLPSLHMGGKRAGPAMRNAMRSNRFRPVLGNSMVHRRFRAGVRAGVKVGKRPKSNPHPATARTASRPPTTEMHACGRGRAVCCTPSAMLIQPRCAAAGRRARPSGMSASVNSVNAQDPVHASASLPWLLHSTSTRDGRRTVTLRFYEHELNIVGTCAEADTTARHG